MVEIDVPEAQREEARQRLLTFHQAVGDVRLGSLRYLASGDESQARRVVGRGAVAGAWPRPGRGHGRRPGCGRPEAHHRHRRAGTQAAQEMVRLAEAAQQARAERSTPARERLEAALGEANGLLGTLAAARIAASAVAADRVEAAAIWIGLAVALMLIASGWLTTRAIGTPLRRLAQTIRTIAGGDAAVAVPDRDRRDEIGAIAGALEALRATVQRAFAQQQMLEQMSTGIIDRRPERRFSGHLLQPVQHRAAAPGRAPAAGQGGCRAGAEHRRAAPQPGAPARHPGRPRAAAAPVAHPGGREVFDLDIAAIRDPAGRYVSAMLTWSVVTAQARLADRFEVEMGSVVEAVAAAADQVHGAAAALSGAAATGGREAARWPRCGQAGADVQAVAASRRGDGSQRRRDHPPGGRRRRGGAGAAGRRRRPTARCRAWPQAAQRSATWCG